MDARQEVFQRLKKQILALEGFKEPLLTEEKTLGRINEAFPNRVFPFSALHEFFSNRPEEATASCAFVFGLLSSRLHNAGSIVYISSSQKIFPPALKSFGILPHQILFLHVKKESDVEWATLEALKCSSLSAVVSEQREISLTTSRRYQLAIEETGVGCFVLRNRPKNLLTTSVSRWHLSPLSSLVEHGLPGLGHPRWRVNLLKVRNGKPGIWDLEWKGSGFCYVSKLAVIHKELQKQTG